MFMRIMLTAVLSLAAIPAVELPTLDGPSPAPTHGELTLEQQAVIYAEQFGEQERKAGRSRSKKEELAAELSERIGEPELKPIRPFLYQHIVELIGDKPSSKGMDMLLRLNRRDINHAPEGQKPVHITRRIELLEQRGKKGLLNVRTEAANQIRRLYGQLAQIHWKHWELEAAQSAYEEGSSWAKKLRDIERTREYLRLENHLDEITKLFSQLEKSHDQATEIHEHSSLAKQFFLIGDSIRAVYHLQFCQDMSIISPEDKILNLVQAARHAHLILDEDEPRPYSLMDTERIRLAGRDNNTHYLIAYSKLLHQEAALASLCTQLSEACSNDKNMHTSAIALADALDAHRATLPLVEPNAKLLSDGLQAGYAQLKEQGLPDFQKLHVLRAMLAVGEAILEHEESLPPNLVVEAKVRIEKWEEEIAHLAELYPQPQLKPPRTTSQLERDLIAQGWNQVFNHEELGTALIEDGIAYHGSGFIRIAWPHRASQLIAIARIGDYENFTRAALSMTNGELQPRANFIPENRNIIISEGLNVDNIASIEARSAGEWNVIRWDYNHRDKTVTIEINGQRLHTFPDTPAPNGWYIYQDAIGDSRPLEIQAILSY